MRRTGRNERARGTEGMGRFGKNAKKSLENLQCKKY